jgi:hypothetical protein
LLEIMVLHFGCSVETLLFYGWMILPLETSMILF